MNRGPRYLKQRSCAFISPTDTLLPQALVHQRIRCYLRLLFINAKRFFGGGAALGHQVIALSSNRRQSARDGSGLLNRDLWWKLRSQRELDRTPGGSCQMPRVSPKSPHGRDRMGRMLCCDLIQGRSQGCQTPPDLVARSDP